MAAETGMSHRDESGGETGGDRDGDGALAKFCGAHVDLL
jgi:hypothetical protein